ncbi:hypothetical protein EK904_003006 [Melospiza melodia maxima]|nr:hypothetical protein EK904_003006 [Melospiza melodia maxima]
MLSLSTSNLFPQHLSLRYREGYQGNLETNYNGTKLAVTRDKEDFAYQKHKENKEHIGDKVKRPKHPVGIVNGIVVKITKNDPKLGETGGKKEHRVTQRHTQTVLRPFKGRTWMPRECQEFKVCVGVGVLQQLSQQPVHLCGAKDVKPNGNNGELQRGRGVVCMSKDPHQNDNHIQNVPDAGEVLKLVDTELQSLFHHIVEDEDTEYNFTGNNEEVPCADISVYIIAARDFLLEVIVDHTGVVLHLQLPHAWDTQQQVLVIDV